MTPDGPNPEHMQKKPRAKKDTLTLPLVLIHDGGGTTAGFWVLGKLQRDVWVIHNPHFWSGATWEGGIDEMALHYLGLLKARGITGRVVLGGWSLGGFLSLAMMRILAAAGKDEYGSLEIAGLLLIDSPYAEPGAERSTPYSFSEPCLPDMPPKVRSTYDKCNRLLETWPWPRWENSAFKAEDLRLSAGGREHTIPLGSVLYKSLEADWTVQNVSKEAYEKPSPTGIASGGTRTETYTPPLSILLRATGRTPALDDGKDPCRADLNRDSLTLGWATGYDSFIKVVMDITNAHYTIFDRYNRLQIKIVTSLLNTAMEIFDQHEIGQSEATT